MSTNYYWKVPPIVLPTGVVIEPDEDVLRDQDRT